jgi:hypothetical protein
MFSLSTCCSLVLVLGAACNALTASSKEANAPTALRGNTRKLVQDHTKLSVQAGSVLIFTGPITTIHSGNVCAFAGLTGLNGTDFLLPTGNGAIVTTDCDPMVQGTPKKDSLNELLSAAMIKKANQIDAEIGGVTFTPGTYYSETITISAATTVTLDGAGVYIFQSGSTLVTGGDTNFILRNGAEAKNIFWALGSSAVIGASSVLEGSIMAGSAITLGAESKVSGCVLATAEVTVAGGCSVSESVSPNDFPSLGVIEAAPLGPSAATNPRHFLMVPKWLLR